MAEPPATSLDVLVVGAGSTAATLVDALVTGEAALTVERVDDAPTAARHLPGTVDCVVVSQQGEAAVEDLLAAAEDVPVVTVGVPENRLAALLSAGVADCLDRETVETRPALAARRVRTAAQAGAAGDSFGHREYERLFDQVPEPVAVIRDGDFVYVNPQTASLLEADRETIVGTTLTDIVPEAKRGETRERFGRLLSGETDRLPYIDREILAFDGQRKQIHVTSGTVDYADREAILITARDVTERRKREQRLTWYETMVETIGDVVYTLDEEYYFTAVAGAAADITGYTPAELEGSHLSTILSSAAIERGLEHRQRIISGEVQTESTEADVQRKDGETVPVEFRYRQLPTEDDGFRGTAGVIRDISERNAQERELRRQNERLEEFAGIVSHDLRNPLNVAAGHLDLARDDCDSDHLDTVAHAHDRMATLIDDTLALARQGREVTDPDPLDLADCVAAAWAHVATAEATLTGPAEATIEGDPDRVQQLLENLFRNAVEHGGGDVAVTVGLLADGFFVADDGPGIPEADREVVFEPGHTADPSGTGFGLAIVEAHGWNVTVTDAEAGGTRFEVTGVSVER
ncbi:PAS domain-containing sensor histidine kinase [Halobacteriales archaeon Cl-PHB]